MLAVEGAGGLQPREIFGQGSVVGVARVRLDGGDNGRGPDKTGDVVDVTVGVVARDAAAEPDGMVDAEKI